MGCIYQVQNKINGMSYIGKTESALSQRKVEHRSEAKNGASSLFHRAVRKHGWNNFEWRILTERDDPKELLLCETALIEILRTKHPHGYNMSDGGEGMLSGYLDEVVKEKRKKNLKKVRRKHLGTSRRKHFSALRRRILSEEQIRRKIKGEF